MVKRISLFLSFVVAITIASIEPPQPALALSLPTPAPTIAPNPLVHLPTFEQLSGSLNSCYHVGAAAGFNYSCSGSSQPTPGPAGAAGDWAVLSKYLDYVETGFQGIGIISNAGIRTVGYLDPGIPHDALAFSPGVNNSIKNATNTASCPNQYPQAINLTTNFYGLPAYLPTVNLISCSGNYYGSVMGNVDAPAVDAWAQYIQNSLLEYGMNAEGGYGGSTEGLGANQGLYGVFMDDMDYPGHRFGYQLICMGIPASLGTTSAGAAVTSCGDSRLNMTQANVDAHPYFQMGRYPQAMNQQWVHGVRNLFRMPARYGLKTFFNDYLDPTMYLYFNTPDRANVEDAICESCLGRNPFASNSFFSQRDWMNQVNSEIVASEWGVRYHSFDQYESSVSDAVYNFASLWMGLRSASDVVITEQISSPLVTPNSKMAFTPFVWIVPSQPINRPASYYFDPIKVNYDPTVTTIPATFGIGTMQQPGGAYLQEFAQCYRGDSGVPVNIGPCAAVINPTGSAVTMPTTTYTYTHTATFTGSGIVKETQFGGGDNGALSVTGSAPPAYNASIAANTAYLLTQ